VDCAETARQGLAGLLGDHLARSVCVRINGLATRWWRDDLALVATLAGVDSLLVPKVESALDLGVVEIERAYLPTARELADAHEILDGAAGARTRSGGAFADVAFERGAKETLALAERYGVRA
jgi:citrate lyase beta subunit